MKTIAAYEQWSLDDILGELEADAISDAECRRHPRFKCIRNVEAVIYPLETGRRPSRCFLLSQDLSRSGLSLIHGVELVPGQRLEVTFKDMPSKQAVVVWCRRLANAYYSIGCKFVKPESGDTSNPSS